MTHRERRERRAERLREWSDKRQAQAAATFAAHEVYHGDVAFNTQPGHIPERARVIAREDRAHESLRKAERMEERAGNIEAQLAASIYDDDPDAVPALEARLAGLEAQRDRYKAYNASVRRGAPDRSLLDDRQRAELESGYRNAPELMGRRAGAFPPYVLSNLSGTIKRNRDRLARLKGGGARMSYSDRWNQAVEENQELAVFLPRPGRMDYVRGAAAIVGRDTHEERIEVCWEGNLYGMDNLVTFEQRVRTAAERLVVKYPTVARGYVHRDALEQVGTFRPVGGLTLTNPEAVQRWEAEHRPEEAC